MSMGCRILVLGGARSGKSQFGQGLLESSHRRPIIIVTAEAGDAEMASRIEAHRASRPGHWKTVEAPISLAEAISAESTPETVVLVDCLTLWLSNLFMASRDLNTETAQLVRAIQKTAGPLILVSNEVGQGIVPSSPLGREFRDAQGRLNQLMAGACDQVILVTAGLPFQIKPAPVPQVSV